MKRIIVNGPSRLVGEVSVSGSKNAALPIIFATVITRGISKIQRLPNIGDVQVALEIIRSFGAVITKLGDVTYIDTRELSYRVPDENLTSKIRASTYLLGACLSRFGKCRISTFGGCNFATRPIDMHLDACMTLGARVLDDRITVDRLKGAEINFNKQSVGATVNAILLAVSADGETLIHGFATEPHIDALIDFLISAGASIERTETEIRINGRELHGGDITVIGDMIEAGTYITSGLMTGGNVTVRNCPTCDMHSFFAFLTSLGANIIVNDDSVTASLSGRGEYISVIAEPYPGFPTDLQPIIAPLMAYNAGGEITDTVWQTRFGYLEALAAFGVDYTVRANRAIINRSRIAPTRTVAPDLRGGAACLLCALVAAGRSEISSAQVILRGYESLTEKLCALGADIKIQEF